MTKDELKGELETLKGELEEANKTIETLKGELEEALAEEDAEKTKTLYWLHPVETMDGAIPTAYGLDLYPIDPDDPNAGYEAQVPLSRVGIELNRKDKAFVAKLADSED